MTKPVRLVSSLVIRSLVGHSGLVIAPFRRPLSPALTPGYRGEGVGVFYFEDALAFAVTLIVAADCFISATIASNLSGAAARRSSRARPSPSGTRYCTRVITGRPLVIGVGPVDLIHTPRRPSSLAKPWPCS